MKSDLFPGTNVGDLSLAHQILEHEHDAIIYHSLNQGVLWTTRHMGFDVAYDTFFEKVRLLLDPSKSLGDRIGEKRDELARNEALIREQPQAVEADGYRGRRLVADVHERITKLGVDANLADVIDLAQYVEDHRKTVQEELDKAAAQERAEKLQEKSGLAKAIGAIKNFAIDYKKILVPALVATTVGGVGGAIAHNYFGEQDRNRPTSEVGHIFSQHKEIVSHPGAKLALDVTDAARAGNAFYIALKYQDENGDAISAGDYVPGILEKTDEAEKSANRAQIYFAKPAAHINRLINGSKKIASAWYHDTDESGHWEEECTTSTDEKGNTTKSCSDVYKCDYIDHTWTFNPVIAGEGVRKYGKGLEGLDLEKPAIVNVMSMGKIISHFLEDDDVYQGLAEKSDRKKYENQMTDVLISTPIKGNNQLEAVITSAQGNRDFSWIHDNYYDVRVFPLKTEDRSHNCSRVGDAPKAYDVSMRFGRSTNDLSAKYIEVTNSVDGTKRQLAKYKRVVAAFAKKNLHDADVYDTLGDATISLHEEINPDSEFDMFSKGWRTAIPILLFLGLGGLGGGLTYGGMHHLEKTRRRERFQREYGSYY